MSLYLLRRHDESEPFGYFYDASYISIRRLAELLGATTLPAFAALCELLAAERSNHYEPSIYRTLPTVSS